MSHAGTSKDIARDKDSAPRSPFVVIDPAGVLLVLGLDAVWYSSGSTIQLSRELAARLAAQGAIAPAGRAV
jgi:hypothetical protein